MMQLQLSAASYCKRNCKCVCHPLAVESTAQPASDREEEEGKLVMYGLSVMQHLYATQSMS